MDVRYMCETSKRSYVFWPVALVSPYDVVVAYVEEQRQHDDVYVPFLVGKGNRVHRDLTLLLLQAKNLLKISL